MAEDKDKNKLQGEGVGAEHGKARKYAAQHTAGGVTTRDDAHDLGVPMAQGDPAEPVGPEDALGAGPKRGDYVERIGPVDYHPHEVLPVPDAKPGEPQSVAVPQRPRAEQIGDVPRRKGGVETADEEVK